MIGLIRIIPLFLRDGGLNVPDDFLHNLGDEQVSFPMSYIDIHGQTLIFLGGGERGAGVKEMQYNSTGFISKCDMFKILPLIPRLCLLVPLFWKLVSSKNDYSSVAVHLIIKDKDPFSTELMSAT